MGLLVALCQQICALSTVVCVHGVMCDVTQHVVHKHMPAVFNLRSPITKVHVHVCSCNL